MTLYRRVLTGQVAPGQHGKFLAAVEEALDYQSQRGIQAQYSVWDSITGHASEVEIISEFESLTELDQFEELSSQDQEFATLRSRVMQAMVFESAAVQLFRRMV
ncbi:MAG TPA: hypothetical protein QGF05_05530 [Dehalococcoidia bacterium]|nr:hypothetical protein [Dehalococcoidia bacterium]